MWISMRTTKYSEIILSLNILSFYFVHCIAVKGIRLENRTSFITNNHLEGKLDLWVFWWQDWLGSHLYVSLKMLKRDEMRVYNIDLKFCDRVFARNSLDWSVEIVRWYTNTGYSQLLFIPKPSVLANWSKEFFFNSSCYFYK